MAPRVQAVLDTNQSHRTGAKPVKGLLTGLLLCSFCEAPMYFQPSKARGKLYRYYQCASRKHTALSADELEELVEDERPRRLGMTLSGNVFGSPVTRTRQS